MKNDSAGNESSANPPAKRRRKVTGSQWAEMRTAFTAGIGLREMARKLNIPAGTVLARAKREGWTRQIQQAKTLAPCKAQSAINASVMQSVAQTMVERGQRHLQRVAGITERVLPHVESMEPGAILDRIEDFDRLDKIGRRTYGLDDERHRGGATINIAIAGMLPP